MKLNFECFIWFHTHPHTHTHTHTKHDAKNTTVMFNFPKENMLELICWVN